MDKCNVSVVIPTYHRLEILINTIEKILNCNPLPDEIIIHIDGNDEETEQAIKKKFNTIKILKSLVNIGPGGGRNKLIEQAKNEIIASFDDDSYPIDQDYFARLLQIFESYPTASIVAATIYHPKEVIQDDTKSSMWVACFQGCGCAYKRSVFLKTDGYLNLQWAYGAEELDLAIQLYAQNQPILQSNWLRVFHDTYLQHHSQPAINASTISNIALLVYIRYPLSLWKRGILQVLNRIIYTIRQKRYRGILEGLMAIPFRIFSYRIYRKPVSQLVLEKFFELRKQPIIAPWSNQDVY